MPLITFSVCYALKGYLHKSKKGPFDMSYTKEKNDEVLILIDMASIEEAQEMIEFLEENGIIENIKGNLESSM